MQVIQWDHPKHTGMYGHPGQKQTVRFYMYVLAEKN